MTTTKAARTSTGTTAAASATEPTLRDRKHALVRAELAQIALAQVLERGFDAVTVDDLAAAAGVSRRSFFRYFASKEEAVTCVFDGIAEVLLREFARGREAESPLRALRVSLQPVLDAFELDPERSRATLKLIRETPYLRGQFLVKQDDWAEQLARSIRARGPKGAGAALMAQLTARVGVAAMDAVMTAWIEQPGQKLGAIADAVFDALSVQPPPPKRRT